MQALERLGLRFQEEIPVQTLLSENFNPSLYGLSKSQRIKVSALRDIVREYNESMVHVAKTITNSQEAASVMYGSIGKLQHEEVWVAYLNRNGEVMNTEMLFKGGLDSSVICHRTVVAKALSCDASAIILYHNHPSGNPLPSPADIKATESLRKALDVFGISLVDHLIISPRKYYSFSDETESSVNTNTFNNI